MHLKSWAKFEQRCQTVTLLGMYSLVWVTHFTLRSNFTNLLSSEEGDYSLYEWRDVMLAELHGNPSYSACLLQGVSNDQRVREMQNTLPPRLQGLFVWCFG